MTLLPSTRNVTGDTTGADPADQSENVGSDRGTGSAVTLVTAADAELARWTAGENAGLYMVVPDSDMLESMLRSPIVRATGEIARVIFDGSIDLDRFLLLIATLPDRFAGEILFIREDGSGYLSTRELKTTRTVRAVNRMDVEVYLRWHKLPARSRETYSTDPREQH